MSNTSSSIEHSIPPDLKERFSTDSPQATEDRKFIHHRACSWQLSFPAQYARSNGHKQFIGMLNQDVGKDFFTSSIVYHWTMCRGEESPFWRFSRLGRIKPQLSWSTVGNPQGVWTRWQRTLPSSVVLWKLSNDNNLDLFRQTKPTRLNLTGYMFFSSFFLLFYWLKGTILINLQLLQCFHLQWTHSTVRTVTRPLFCTPERSSETWKVRK